MRGCWCEFEVASGVKPANIAVPSRLLMNWRNECVVVIPCLNEADAVCTLIESVRRRLPHVIVVDDGSTDATARLAKEAGAEVIRHAQPKGKGAALAAGWRRAVERGFSWVMTMDGDGQHSPEDIPKLLEAGCDAEIVIGNRMANAKGMPWVRRFVNRWMSTRLSRAAGMELPDSQCGFRLMDLHILKTLPLRTTHFEIESEVLMAFVARGHEVRFVPVRTIYNGGGSKIHPWRDTVRWFRWWRQMRKVEGEQTFSLQEAAEEKHAVGLPQ